MNQRQMQKGIQAYGAARRSQVPLRALVDLYDAAFSSVSRAKASCMQSDPEAEFNAVQKASSIMQGLASILNEADERAKPITMTMYEYYKVTLTQLHRAKQSKSPEAELRYSSVQRQILNMRNAWASVAGMPSLTSRDSANVAEMSANSAE